MNFHKLCFFCTFQAGQDKTCKSLTGWTKHIVNHFWYAAQAASSYDQFIVSLIRLFRIITIFVKNKGGRSGGAKVLGKLPVPGCPTNLDYSRARAYCACNRCGWGLFGHFFSHLSLLFSFSLSLGDGPI